MTIKYQRGPARAQSTRRARREARGYPSDLTDAQWQVIAPYLPPDQPGRRGRPLVWPRRLIVEAILYLDRTGCAWRYLPGDFPPWQTVYGYFAAWRDDGTLARLHDVLRELVRASAGRNAEPTAAVLDSQSVRAADVLGETADATRRTATRRNSSDPAEQTSAHARQRHRPHRIAAGHSHDQKPSSR